MLMEFLLVSSAPSVLNWTDDFRLPPVESKVGLLVPASCHTCPKANSFSSSVIRCGPGAEIEWVNWAISSTDVALLLLTRQMRRLRLDGRSRDRLDQARFLLRVGKERMRVRRVVQKLFGSQICERSREVLWEV